MSAMACFFRLFSLNIPLSRVFSLTSTIYLHYTFQLTPKPNQTFQQCGHSITYMERLRVFWKTFSKNVTIGTASAVLRNIKPTIGAGFDFIASAPGQTVAGQAISKIVPTELLLPAVGFIDDAIRFGATLTFADALAEGLANPGSVEGIVRRNRL